MLPLERLDAVLFDLDGVLTDTARLHESAWTGVFGELFERVGQTRGDQERPTAFTGEDYRRLAGGEPRLDGVLGVLADHRIVWVPVTVAHGLICGFAGTGAWAPAGCERWPYACST